jgi:hypothetical protein
MNKVLLYISIFFAPFALIAQDPWDCSTYPDEAGFQERMKPMLGRIAEQGFGIRSLASSQCPDTDLPVKTWAVEGETIISPYTGRAYIQGPTGYFGPKARNEKGEIVAFGGDPLKYDLPPATATLILNPDDEKAKAFLSIPGNMRQQYHFACKNWARFYPLMKEHLSPTWHQNFQYWVGSYSERRRPSDGARELLPLSTAHNLVGEKGHLLGGNTKDGGTENHKTMWRTSALLYSQLFPDTAEISGHSTIEAEKITKEMLKEYMKRILKTGNGEYDSQVYYPHSIEAFLNLYDFSPDEETRQLAKFVLDYYFVTYGLKVIDGTIAGAQKRGYLVNANANEMEQMQWAFFNQTSRNMEDAVVPIQQATTTYRPNKIILNIVRKEVPLPFEAKMSRPFYHMDVAHAFAETFYCSESFAMGNIQMTIVDNPNQQMVWSLVAEGKDGPLCFSGGQPLRGSTSGHSPYTQTLHSKGTVIVCTAPTKILADADTLVAPNYSKIIRPNLWHLPGSEQGKHYETRNRHKYARSPLHNVNPPNEMSAEDLVRFWNESKGSASTWFFFPKELSPTLKNDVFYIEANNTFVAVMSLTKDHFVVNPSMEVVDQIKDRSARRFFSRYGLISFAGKYSGYVVEAVEKGDFDALEDFIDSVEKKTRLKNSLSKKLNIKYHSSYGDEMELHYQPTGLRCKGIINGVEQDWDNHTSGGVYQSPYVSVKNGIMKVSDGKEGYTVDFNGSTPYWQR